MTVLEALPEFRPQVTLFEFATMAGKPVVAATRQQGTDNPIWAVFTLDRELRHQVLITITDGDPREVADLLAELAAAPLCVHIGKTVTIDSEYLKMNGRVGAIFGSTAGSNALARLPDQIDAKGAALSVFFVIFLDAAELRLAREHGSEALGEFFDQSDRNYAAIGASRGDA